MDLLNKSEMFWGAVDVISNPKHTKWIGPAILGIELVFCALIIRTVPYTEIDWRAYMQQVEQYIAGERDYTKIHGDTGPLVYPAMHVYIYRGLHAITFGGVNITIAQVCFLFLYVFNMGLVMLCYRLAKVPPYVFPMLMLSKRLHSIYVLRCFNDGFAMTALFAAIYCYQKHQWNYGSIILALGLAVKMNILLVLPGLAVILYQALGPIHAVSQISILVQLNLLLGVPFLRNQPRTYLLQAYSFTRQFEYRWSVNWKFISEETFLSKEFSIGLLIVHISLLGFFVFTRWLKPIDRTNPRTFLRLFFTKPIGAEEEKTKSRLTPEFILTTILTSNVIGMLCARSLHYQFFAWLGWATPFLLWRSGMHWALMYLLWAGQELAWLQYPSNDLSSKIVVGVLGVTVLQIWLGTDDPVAKVPRPLPDGFKSSTKTTAISKQAATTTKKSSKNKSLTKSNGAFKTTVVAKKPKDEILVDRMVPTYNSESWEMAEKFE